MTKIRDIHAYAAAFPSDTIDRKRALDFALDIRKFEIGLYWRRATYFWTLIASTLAGYFALASSGPGNVHLTIIVGCIGFLLSIGWFLVNRGSKYWQQNWERHVDCLSDDQVGPLYRTVISKELFRPLSLTGGYPYSVSKVNQATSFFVMLLWPSIVLPELVALCIPLPVQFLQLALVVTATAVFAIILFFFCKSGEQGEDREVRFVQAGLS
ncbi:hypothetical protein AAFN88_05090 [Pelagibius sp. CAU 1746]|uniref:RipA family octameric membrane protein n=1 Tax=Pelagibius sp. CAU 1746 TaxID=3140370 RepID=UPI00325A5B51